MNLGACERNMKRPHQDCSFRRIFFGSYLIIQGSIAYKLQERVQWLHCEFRFMSLQDLNISAQSLSVIRPYVFLVQEQLHEQSGSWFPDYNPGTSHVHMRNDSIFWPPFMATGPVRLIDKTVTSIAWTEYIHCNSSKEGWGEIIGPSSLNAFA